MSNRRASVEVQGLRQLRKTMAAAGVSIEDLKSAHNEVAQTVARMARARVPHRTGRLASSIRGTGQQGSAVVRAGTAGVPYANPIHWGWPNRHITPNLFVWQPIQDGRSEYLPIYMAALEHIIGTIEGVPSL